jgi:hypothetical protein
MSTLSSVTDEYADDSLIVAPEDQEPNLDDYGDEPNTSVDRYNSGEEEDDPWDDEMRHLPARRAPRLEMFLTTPASAVVKDAWATVSELDPALFGRWTERPGRRGRQPSTRMTGVPEQRFRAVVLRCVLKGHLNNVGAVVDLKSLTRDQPDLDYTYLNHGDARTVRDLIVGNGEQFRKALLWVELLENRFTAAPPRCPDLTTKQVRRRQFLRVVWAELAALPDPTVLNAHSPHVTDLLDTIVAHLNTQVRAADARTLLQSQPVHDHVLASLSTWTPIPEAIEATSTDALRRWARQLVFASEAQASASLGALGNGLPEDLSQAELTAQLVSLARAHLVHPEETSALRRQPVIDSAARGRQDHLSTAPLNQALYQRLQPAFRNGAPLGVTYRSLPRQLEAEGQRCATWIGVESPLARLTLLLGFEVVLGIMTMLAAWSSLSRGVPKDSLYRRVANSARRFGSLRMETAPSHAITSRTSRTYQSIIAVMETEYMRRLWRAVHRREFTGIGAALDLPTITTTLTGTMLTITSWVNASYEAEQRRGVDEAMRLGSRTEARTRPDAHPAQPLVSYLSGYLHDASRTPDPAATEAAMAFEAYLQARPPAHRNRRTSTPSQSRRTSHADLARLAIETASTISSCCDASADLDKRRGQATYDDILDLIQGM